MSSQLIPFFPPLAELPFNPLLFFSLLFIIIRKPAHTHSLCTLTSALRNDRHPSASMLICFASLFIKCRERKWYGGRVPCERGGGESLQKEEWRKKKGCWHEIHSKKRERGVLGTLAWKVEGNMRSTLGDRKGVL